MTQIMKNPRVLFVTPEVAYLPHGMGNIADYLGAKAGGLADVSAALISALFRQGADVHVAIPEYRALYNLRLPHSLQRGIRSIKTMLPEERIHLARDRSFFYLNRVYTNFVWENTKIAIAFQREVINNIIPAVQPDLIHCNDWMTGLIPAIARQAGIPCLFTIHNIHTEKCVLRDIEDRGIDAAEFWQNLYFEWPPTCYEAIRSTDPVDFLASGILSIRSALIILMPALPEKASSVWLIVLISMVLETPSLRAVVVPFFIKFTSRVIYGLKAEIKPKKCPDWYILIPSQ